MGIVIPGRLVRFIEQHANIGGAGTRDRNLVPYGHRVSGWRVSADARTLTAIIAEQFTEHLLEALEDNGQIAVTIEEFPSHETYQFKGRYLGHRPVSDEDRVVVNRTRDRFVRNVQFMFPHAPAGVLKAYILAPALAVDLEVHEIFLQTPGPGAGSRLVPATEVATT